jgi:serine protease Do
VEIFSQWKESVVYVTGPVLTAAAARPALEEFFRLPDKKIQESSIGSGFVIHSSGYILTNAHAAEKVIFHQVALADGKTYPADLVASIHENDVALLKLDAGRPLKPVKLGLSGDVMVGENVIVIGNPHGLLHTCTTGVLSAVGRTTNVSDLQNLTLRDLLQTDASINPGSSGGPWFNVLGEVIGLTASKKRDADNIGFAVPIATLRRLLPEMLDVERRYGLVTGLSLDSDGPCRVTAVQPDSPAAKAGIQAGDVLVRLADRPTPTVADFHLNLVGHKPQETISLELLREGKPLSIALTLGLRPKPDGAALLQAKLGLAATPLAQAQAKAMLLQVPCGLMVTAVDPKFYATVEHKPAPGDVLARIGHLRPRDLEQVGLILEKVQSGQTVPLVMLRNKDNVATRIDIKLVLP